MLVKLNQETGVVSLERDGKFVIGIAKNDPSAGSVLRYFGGLLDGQGDGEGAEAAYQAAGEADMGHLPSGLAECGTPQPEGLG